MPENILKPEAWPKGTKIAEDGKSAEVELKQPTNLGGLAREETRWDAELAKAQYNNLVEQNMQSGGNLGNNRLSFFKNESKEIRKENNMDPYGLKKLFSRKQGNKEKNKFRGMSV